VVDLTSVCDLSLAYQVSLVGGENDGRRAVLVIALNGTEQVDDVVVRLAVSHRVDENEAVNIAVVSLKLLQQRHRHHRHYPHGSRTIRTLYCSYALGLSRVRIVEVPSSSPIAAACSITRPSMLPNLTVNRNPNPNNQHRCNLAQTSTHRHRQHQHSKPVARIFPGEGPSPPLPPLLFYPLPSPSSPLPSPPLRNRTPYIQLGGLG